MQRLERAYTDPSAAHEFAMTVSRVGKNVRIDPRGHIYIVSWSIYEDRDGKVAHVPGVQDAISKVDG